MQLHPELVQNTLSSAPWEHWVLTSGLAMVLLLLVGWKNICEFFHVAVNELLGTTDHESRHSHWE